MSQQKLSASKTASKKPRIEQKFKTDYSVTWPFISLSKLGDTYAFCKPCGVDIMISHGGRDDIRKHIGSKKHQSRASAQSQTRPVNSFFKDQSVVDFENSVTNAELLFLKFIIEHNIPISAADHAGGLFRAMFPDSKISGKYGCARTKTTAISKWESEKMSEELAERMRTQPFSLATDGSNDSGCNQLYPIVVRCYSSDHGKVITDILNIAECKESSTGENIFKILDCALKKYSIPWSNCVSFGCDNASVMTGKHKGVVAFIKKENSNVMLQGCPCHLLHIAAKHGSSQLTVSVEDILIDVYYYFDKSSKRKNEFEKFQLDTGVELSKILKHGATRWLSLASCINRLLKQWPALEAFFREQSNMTPRLQRIVTFFANPMAKAYCLFLDNILPMFTKANTFLQTDDPVFHKMQEALQDIFLELLIRFVKPKVVADCLNIFEINYKERSNQKHRQDVVVSKEVRSYINQIKQEGKISADDEKIFFNEVRQFFSEACSYISEKLPLQDKSLAHAQIMNVKSRMDQSFNSLEHFVRKFPCLIKVEERDQLEVEFSKYQADKLNHTISSAERVDVAWHLISQLTGADGQPKYSVLSKAMLGLCVIPHSNAGCERVFSLVRKAKTEFRASMSTDTLSSLMIQRVRMLSREEVCYETNFTKEYLSQAKKACMLSLQSNC